MRGESDMTLGAPDELGLSNDAKFVVICNGTCGPGGIFPGVVSVMYGCSKHCLHVKRASGSYLSRSDTHSIKLRGTCRSKSPRKLTGLSCTSVIHQ